MTPEYLALVGPKEAAFRREHPERRYFHFHQIDHRCKWCGRLPISGDTECPSLLMADMPPKKAPPARPPEIDYGPPDDPLSSVGWWGKCTCSRDDCPVCGS